MTAFIDAERWLTFLQQEYLETFIRDGGSAIKFAVPFDSGSRQQLEAQLAQRAAECGYLLANIGADTTRVQADHIFFRLAEQVPWQQLSRMVIEGLAAADGYLAAIEGDGPLLPRIAEANRLEPTWLLGEMRRKLSKDVFTRHDLSKDFRVAVMHLCLAELTGGPEGSERTQVLTDWLTGRNKAVAAVKPYQIFSPINRSNARYLFESLLQWVRFAGFPGLVIMLDIARVTVARNPHDDRLYYNKPAVLDAYEVLREFIDRTDRLYGCLIIVAPAPEFLDDEPLGRGIGAYEALKFRVIDEIRDRDLVNPMASMVRLSSTSQGSEA